MRILVVGNLGYVGSVLTPYLMELGHTVVGYDVGYFADAFLTAPQAPDEQHIGDVRELDSALLMNVDAVVHLAALSNDTLGQLDPAVTEEINVGGLRRTAAAAKEHGVARFVFASSCSMYGRSEGSAALDETAPLNPLTAYARSKADGEALLRSMADENFRPTSLRFSTAYGLSPRLRLDLVVNNLVASGLRRGTIVLESDGTPWRPLIHVEDMAQAIALSLVEPLDLVGSEAINVGDSAENYQVKTIASIVAKSLGGLPITVGPAGGADERSYNVDFSKVARLLPTFAVRWRLPAGVVSLVDAMRSHFNPMDFDTDRYIRLRRVAALQKQQRVDKHLFVSKTLLA